MSMSNETNILDYISTYASGNGSLSVRYSEYGPINRMVLEEYCKEGRLKGYVPMCNVPEDHHSASHYWCLVHPFSTIHESDNRLLVVDNLTNNQLMVVRLDCAKPWAAYNLEVYGQDADGEQFEVKNLSLLSAIWFYIDNRTKIDSLVNA